MIGKGKLFVGPRAAGTPSPEFVAVPIPKHAMAMPLIDDDTQILLLWCNFLVFE